MRNSILVLSICLSILSCKKEDSTSANLTETEKDRLMAEENNTAESIADDVSVMSDDAYYVGELRSRGGSGGSGIMGDTVKITRVDSTITIDFGTNGILGRDGKTRKGKIHITFSGGYRSANAKVSQTFDGYSVNNYGVAGSRSVTYQGLNASSHHNWEIISNLTITKPNGGIITWNSQRTRTMIAGASTPLNAYDDEYTISGSANGVTSNGDTYTYAIGTPLKVKISFNPPSICRYIIDGTLTYTRNSRTIQIDYGYGGTNSCDNQALLTYNGITAIITL